MESLSPKQLAILEAEGDILVLGGPGSGKTTSGLGVARACIRGGLAPHQQVLLLSFSNSAVLQLAQASKLQLSVEERGRLKVQTFHGLCWDILRTHGYLIGLPRQLAPLAPERKASLSSGRTSDEWLRESHTMAKTQGKVCFDLFASLARSVIEQHDAVAQLQRSCFPLIIVDEFQDTDDDQWAVLDVLTQTRRVIALADPDQRIYDFRPGVRPERLDAFRESRRPTVVDLEDDNHRSPNSDLVQFAHHILHPDRGPCRSDAVGISTYQFRNQLGVSVKYAIDNVRRRVERVRGRGPVSIAVLAATNAMVQQISSALRRPTPKAKWDVEHDVFVDCDEMANAWHVALAFLDGAHDTLDVHAAKILGSLADFYRCHDTATAREDADRLAKWGREVMAGTWPRRSPMLRDLRAVLEDVRRNAWGGEPAADIERLLRSVESCKDDRLNDVASWCRIRAPVREGEASHRMLTEHFRKTGAYCGASRMFERALLNDRLLDRYRTSRGCTVMTMHRCKGREYDAVVVIDGLREPHRLVLRNDMAPFHRSRRLLRVAVTRARYCAHIVTPKESRCPLLPVDGVSVAQSAM